MIYSIEEHRLAYAVWAACRAAQAGSSKATVAELSAALHECGVVDYIRRMGKKPLSAAEFDKLHRQWCNAIIAHVATKAGKQLAYGIAAKLLNMFLKGYFVLAGNEETALGQILHPPVDSFLLKGIDKEKGTHFSQHYKWQKLSEETYFELINALRAVQEQGEAFWRIEKYWMLNQLPATRNLVRMDSAQ